jgi:hypothetical protein
MDDILELLPILHLLPGSNEFLALGRLYQLFQEHMVHHEDDEEELMPMIMSFQMTEDVFTMLLSLYRDWISLKAPISHIIAELFPGNRAGYTEVWPLLVTNQLRLWHLTGETETSLQQLVDALPDTNDNGRPCLLTKRDAVLMTLIWLRQYPTYLSLATLFSIPCTTCRETINRMVLRLLILVSGEVRWHRNATWQSLAGRFLQFPTVVGMIDGTIIRINVPTGMWT